MRSGAEGERPAAAASTPEKTRAEASGALRGPGSGEDGAGAAAREGLIRTGTAGTGAVCAAGLSAAAPGRSSGASGADVGVMQRRSGRLANVPPVNIQETF